MSEEKQMFYVITSFPDHIYVLHTVTCISLPKNEYSKELLTNGLLNHVMNTGQIVGIDHFIAKIV